MRVALLFLLAGCVRFTVPDVTGTCSASRVCPPGQSCNDGVCRVELAVAECKPACPAGEICINGTCACDRNTCDGCCSDGRCIASSDQTCGASGADCASCSGNTPTCRDGLCVANCSGGVCGSAGCCTATSCEAGTSNAACGTGGAACVSCTGSSNGSSCINGACGCGEDTDCPPEKICEGGACIAGCRQSSDCPLYQACSGTTCSNTVCDGAHPCNGGCCDNGVCVPGGGASACGLNGAQCASCGALACVNGSCACTEGGAATQCTDNDPCTPDTCVDGVCQHGARSGCRVDENTCIEVGDQTDTQCGSVTGNCVACTGTRPSCVAGACDRCYVKDTGHGPGVDVCGASAQCYSTGECLSNTTCGTDCDGATAGTTCDAFGCMCAYGCTCNAASCGGVCGAPAYHCGCVSNAQCTGGRVCNVGSRNCYTP